jgi:hypothetical protein
MEERYENLRYEGQSLEINGGTGSATWTLERDHSGRMPREVKIWYLRCDECGEEIADLTNLTCDCKN